MCWHWEQWQLSLGVRTWLCVYLEWKWVAPGCTCVCDSWAGTEVWEPPSQLRHVDLFAYQLPGEQEKALEKVLRVIGNLQAGSLQVPCCSDIPENCEGEVSTQTHSLWEGKEIIINTCFGLFCSVLFFFFSELIFLELLFKFTDKKSSGFLFRHTKFKGFVFFYDPPPSPA